MGEPSTGRRGTGGEDDQSHAVRVMQRARVALSITCYSKGTGLTAGERSYTETVTLRSECQGQLTWAVHLWGAADALRESIRVPIPLIERADYERSIATVRTHLGEKDFAAAWEGGRAMTPEQAITS
jgi:hypothetical protein